VSALQSGPSKRSAPRQLGVNVSGAEPQMEQNESRCRVLIPFASPYLYGMERAVIETFSALLPQVMPEFQLSNMGLERGTPVIKEVDRRQFAHSFLPDHKDWPHFGKPRSVRAAMDLIVAIVRGNMSTLRRAFHCDVLYIPTSISMTAVLAATYCRLRRKKVVFHFHDLRPGRSFMRLWSVLASDFIHNAVFGHEYILQRYPFLCSKSHVVFPYVLECPTWAPLPAELESEFAGKRNIVFVGQVSAHKGVDLLLEAFHFVARSHPDAKLHIVGGCSQTFRPKLDELLAMSNGSIKVWGYRERAWEWIRRACVYVHPSPPSRFHECFPRGALEAMSQGVPTVCFRSGGLQEIVAHEKTGLICESETAACLATSILRLLDDPALRDACSREAQAQFDRKYSRDTIRNQWLGFFGLSSSAGVRL